MKIRFLALICLLATSLGFGRQQDCPASGTLRLEPADAVAGQPADLVATIDSNDAACASQARADSFVILTAPDGVTEVDLVPEDGELRGAIVVPAAPWQAQLFGTGIGTPLATLHSTVQSAPSPPPPADLWHALGNSPGALWITGAAVALGALALLGLPAPRRRIPVKPRTAAAETRSADAEKSQVVLVKKAGSEEGKP